MLAPAGSSSEIVIEFNMAADEAVELYFEH